MEFTGERFLPECLGEIAIEHYHRYFFATAFVAGKDVLDIASGEGYGTYVLSRHASHVTGVDVSQEAVSAASEKYSSPKLNFLQGNASSIPLADASVDVVVSFETLEHLLEQKAMLSEIKRVLRTGGLLIMSTPNTRRFKDGDTNFHLKELDQEEFLALLNEQFANIALQGQKIVFGSFIADGSEGTVLMRQKNNPASADKMFFIDESMYFIALASDEMLPPSAPSVLERSLEDSALCMDLRNKIGELQNTISKLYDDSAQQEKNLRLAESQTQEAEKALACLIASNSWRITAPLRWLARKFRRG